MSTSRRTFMRAAAMTGAAMAVASSAALAGSGGGRRRYCIVGTGSRARMYEDAIFRLHKAHAELVGICDTNPGRLALVQGRAQAAGVAAPKAYAAEQFDQMIADQKPDHVIVTTVDSFHHQYIIRAMELGCDAITEKPMTNTGERCRAIFDAIERTGRKCRVTFNYRYSPPRTQVKDILMSGAIGDVLSVDFHWLLNTHHGADYFRRWHGFKKFSQGLMLHKATHHFDLVNWWLSAVPVEVFATGKREFYTSAMAKRMGLQGAHERCLTCPEKEKCGFYFDLAADKNLKALYLDQEKHDGYFRDQCVWRDDHDIEDTMNVLVKYDNNVTLAYSLNAFNAWEGYTIGFNGTKGRLEHAAVEKIYTSGTSTTQGAIQEGGITTRIIPLRGPVQQIEPWSAKGAHGGGDEVLLNDIFLPDAPNDKYLRAADHRAGAASILIGVAAKRCFETKQPVKIAELLPNLTRPDYPPMPTHSERVPMPGKEPA